MAYTKHNWLQRLGTGLNKFKDTITNQVFALVNQPDTVTQAGTPLRADWLNEMEQGIFEAHVIADAAKLKADAALPANGYTANDVLAKLKMVHGAGSGINADLLDGQHASAFATATQGKLADDAMPRTGGIFTGGITANGLSIPTGKQGTQADAPLYTNSLVNKEYADKLNTNIGASNISPKVMTRLVGLTKHADCPNGSEYWYIITFMHSANKVQIALPYARSGNAIADMYVRMFYVGHDWSPWSWFGANPKTLFGSTVPSTLAPGQIFVKI